MKTFHHLHLWIKDTDIALEEVSFKFNARNMEIYLDIDIAPHVVNVQHVEDLMKRIRSATLMDFDIHETKQINIDPDESAHAVHYFHAGPIIRIDLHSPSVLV